MLKLKCIINEQKTNVIKIYHGVPLIDSAKGIKKKGLRQIGNFIVIGSDGSPPIKNRSYVTTKLWNAVRYSFMKPNSTGIIKWEDYIKEEPYSFIFEFNISINDLLPDEDAIGAGVSKFLNGKNNKLYQKYLTNIDKKLLNNTKRGSFSAFSEIGKKIEPNLTDGDRKKIIASSITMSINSPIYPIKSYKIIKPDVQFFKTEKEYINWFNKYNKTF